MPISLYLPYFANNKLTISLKNKNGLKSILVRRFFEVFLHFFISLYKYKKFGHFLSKISQTQNYQYFAQILNNKLYRLKYKNGLKPILVSRYFWLFRNYFSICRSFIIKIAYIYN